MLLDLMRGEVVLPRVVTHHERQQEDHYPNADEIERQQRPICGVHSVSFCLVKERW